MKVIDLLNKIANGEEVPKKIKYDNAIYEYNEQYDYKNELQINYYSVDEGIDFFNKVFCYSLNDEVEIIEEEKKLHANDIEFNINNDKKDCIITLDENDLGIDKLHLDNCYFYKENDKWYVRKYDFKTIELEKHKIPEKLDYKYENIYHNISKCKHSEIRIIDKINEILDYLEEIE